MKKKQKKVQKFIYFSDEAYKKIKEIEYILKVKNNQEFINISAIVDEIILKFNFKKDWTNWD